MKNQQLTPTEFQMQPVKVTLVVQPCKAWDHLSSNPRNDDDQFLSYQAFEKNCGVSESELSAISNFMADHDLKILEISKAARTVLFEATAEQLSVLFSVHMQALRIDNQYYWHTDDEIKVPAAIAHLIHSVVGLNNHPV